jgi:hypothetical protein
VGDRSRGRFATPADSPRHDYSPYSHVHVRRECLGFVRRSKYHFLPPRAQPQHFDSQLCHIAVTQRRDFRCGAVQGRGAGTEATASGVLADTLELCDTMPRGGVVLPSGRCEDTCLTKALFPFSLSA